MNNDKLKSTIEFEMQRYDFLDSIGMTKKEMQDIMKNEYFWINLSNVSVTETITAKKVLELAATTLKYFSEDLPEDFLLYVYNYLINLNFKDTAIYNEEEKYEKVTKFFIQLLRSYYVYEDKSISDSEKYKFFLLTKEELVRSENKQEYINFMRKFNSNYVYELMRLSDEVTPFNTLEHVVGVNHVAMHIGRQFDKLGCPINLSIVCGTSISHDIGKFGCKVYEQNMVPYFHYYYTYKWFDDIEAPVTANIAGNHSTWDLELENLSVESLILIYSDFRVKNKNIDGKDIMTIYSLNESFQVILDKLDNLDEAKIQRYKKVYNKLKDFENYMESIGINTDMLVEGPVEVNHKDYSIMYGNDVVENLKYNAIRQNISLMSKLLHSSNSISNIIEQAKSETNYNNIRSYLDIIDEYNLYLIQSQKLLSINFMYELMTFKHGDVRRRAASILANIISEFDEKYSKKLPKGVTFENNSNSSLKLYQKYLDLIINPDFKITRMQKSLIRDELSTFIMFIFLNSEPKASKKYLDIFIDYFKEYTTDTTIIMPLLKASRRIPLSILDFESSNILLDYVYNYMNSEHEEVRLSALFTLRYLITGDKISGNRSAIIEKVQSMSSNKISVNYVRLSIIKVLGLENKEDSIIDNHISRKTFTKIFLDNLKFATPTINKIVNIEILMENAEGTNETLLMQIGAHFSNLLKTNSNTVVRKKAGKALLKLADSLSEDQRNEIAVELIKGLEMDAIEFSKTMPEYLGKLVLLLSPNELDEIIFDIKTQYKNSNVRAGTLYLDTVGVIISNYESYKGKYDESNEKYEKRLMKLLGIILNGLSSYKQEIKREAIFVLGKYVFASHVLDSKSKRNIFTLIYKKLLTLVSEKEQNEIFFFHSAASFNHIYRFISDYLFNNGKFEFEDNKKVAFFPGTFDPFSLSHKKIAEDIRNLGYDVYLSVDEFSWSKRTQPRLIRRQIITMSVADEAHMYLFPDEIPMNIANEKNIAELKDMFKDNELYIVMGSDVIGNASAYKYKATPNSIHTMNHILFDRYDKIDDIDKLNENTKNITGEIVNLHLPVDLEEVSSTQIRENIDKHRDISYLIDTDAQNYIYDKGLYLGEPKFKREIERKAINVKIERHVSKLRVSELIAYNNINLDEIPDEYYEKDPSIIYIIDENNGENIGAALFHRTNTSLLYDEFGSLEVAQHLRENISGNIKLIDGLFINELCVIPNFKQLLITEVLAYFVSENYASALYCNTLNKSRNYRKLLLLQGFRKIEKNNTGDNIMLVDMRFPITLVMDSNQFIKPPYNKSAAVITAIRKAQVNLQDAMVKLYPGSLVLTFDNEMIQHKMVKKICELNKVPNKTANPILRGENMCVPFGAILKGKVVPNTITKSIHTDKVMARGLESFKIKAYPFYSPLENQVKVIKAFEKPVILVDDLLNKGYRLNGLDPILKQNDIDVKATIVGIMSSSGKDLLASKNREVDCAYFIPNLKVWFNENLLYPFIGGDTIDRNESSSMYLVPSINFVLPYAQPTYMKDVPYVELHEFSHTVLVNARNIMVAIEKEYQRINERRFTIKQLSEVMISPRIPERGHHIEYDLNIEPSKFIEEDLELLKRFKR